MSLLLAKLRLRAGTPPPPPLALLAWFRGATGDSSSMSVRASLDETRTGGLMPRLPGVSWGVAIAAGGDAISSWVTGVRAKDLEESGVDLMLTSDAAGGAGGAAL